MTKKTRRKFTQAQRDKAVDDYLSGERSASQIAIDLDTDVQTIYRWKVLREEKLKGARIDELLDEGQSKDSAQRILELELEIEAYQKKVAEQAVMLDLLKKIPRVNSLSVRERIDWIDQNYKKVGSKKRACKMMEISTSTYYADPKVTRAEKEEFEADIRGKIEQIRVDMKGAGYRQLLGQLKRSGIKIGERRLRRIIREAGLQIVPKKKFVKTTDSDHDCLVYPNLIQGMTLDGPNQVWGSDITYIRINNGFVYLAVVLDFYSRKIVGWSLSKKIDGNLTLDALNMALLRRRPPRGVIHHSDRGIQYLCRDYVKGFQTMASISPVRQRETLMIMLGQSLL